MSTLTLEIVKNNFEQWRASLKKEKAKIPQHLWEQAVDLAERYPISKITASLRLSGGQINKKRREYEQQLKSKPSVDFFEMPLNSDIQQKETKPNGSKIEISRPDGSALTIEHLAEDTLMQILKKFVGDL